MFIACPHCHELVVAHPQPRQSAELCPRCGGVLQPSGDGATESVSDIPPVRSFATLLRGSDTAAADPEPAPLDEPTAPTNVQASTGVPLATAVPATPVPVVAEGAAESADDATQPAAATEAAVGPEPPSSSSDSGVATATTNTTDDSEPSTAKAEPAMVSTAAPALADAAGQQASHGRGPSFIRASRTATVPAGAAKAQWWVLAALSLLLVIQVLLADRARLAADAGWRPLLVSLCGVLRCSLPPWREPAAFVMLSRDVRPVAGAPGTLQAQATFRNDARWPQPWPVLVLTLKDADGRTLGARALMPDEYLDASADGNEIASGQSAQIAVRIREPSASVVAYSFDFR